MSQLILKVCQFYDSISQKAFLNSILPEDDPAKRAFKCGTCGKSYMQKAHLVVHKRTHSRMTFKNSNSVARIFYVQKKLRKNALTSANFARKVSVNHLILAFIEDHIQV